MLSKHESLVISYFYVRFDRRTLGCEVPMQHGRHRVQCAAMHASIRKLLLAKYASRGGTMEMFLTCPSSTSHTIGKCFCEFDLFSYQYVYVCVYVCMYVMYIYVQYACMYVCTGTYVCVYACM